MAGAGSKGQVEMTQPGGYLDRQGAPGGSAAGGKSLYFPPGRAAAELESHSSVGFLGPLCSWVFWVVLC